MNYLLSITLLMLGLINAGILAISLPNIFREKELKGRWYFAVSLLSGALGLFGMGAVVMPVFQGPQPVWFSTPANVMILLTFVAMWLFAESLTIEISRQRLSFICAFVLVWALGFEYLRENGTVYSRSIYLYTPQMAVVIAQIRALTRALRTEFSQQIYSLKIISWIELPLLMARFIALHVTVLPANYSLTDLSGFVLLLLALHFGLQVVSFSVASGYWLEVATKRKNSAEREVQRINELLFEKNTLIQALTRMHKVAETGALSASLAHEINQPLSAVQLDAQMLQVLLKDHQDDEKVHSFLQRILSNNARAAQTIKSLRKLFSADQSPSQLSFIDPIIQEAILLTKAQSEHHNVQMVYQLAAPDACYFDCSDLQIVLINLINNAIDSLRKASTSEPCIQISSWQTPDQTYVRLVDNGPGVPDEIKAELFSLLRTSKEQGMGIGLWLSRSLIERQGGNLLLETSAQAGASFLISLPRG
jgi:signal transduction histidine kinase